MFSLFLGNLFASFSIYESFPFHSFTVDLQGANYFGCAVDYSFVAPMSADQVSTVVDAYVTGFLVKAEALYLWCRLGGQTNQLSHKPFYLHILFYRKLLITICCIKVTITKYLDSFYKKKFLGVHVIYRKNKNTIYF